MSAAPLNYINDYTELSLNHIISAVTDRFLLLAFAVRW